MKHELLSKLDTLAQEHSVLASCSSAITASDFADELTRASRSLVVQPGNPPFLIRVIEVVPAPFTLKGVVNRTCDLLRSVGLSPNTVRKEIRGFVFS